MSALVPLATANLDRPAVSAPPLGDLLALPSQSKSGWFCPRCLFVFRTGEPTRDDWRGMPLTEQDVALGATRKIGLVCPNGCQTGQWEPWMEDMTDLSTPIYDRLLAERGRP